MDDPAAIAPLPALDHAQLRAFVAVADSGSVTRAAEVVGRTQSAVSMQMGKLEETLGRKLFRKEGRGLVLTDHGVYLLGRARQLLSLNDEIVAGFRQPRMAGLVRLGVPDDYAPRFLPPILARFADAYPNVDVAVECETSSSLRRKLEKGELDLALCTGSPERPEAELVWKGRLVWVGPDSSRPGECGLLARNPLPMAFAHPGCSWRRAAEAELKRIGRSYRVVYISDRLTGQLAAVQAGIAIGVVSDVIVPPGTRVLGKADGLPELPGFAIALEIGPHANQPVAKALGRHMADSFAQEAAVRARAA
ncbi:MAG: LysR family transcriptional regulator [Acetobacteraceae bacterium]|nr:LysR family transcriptional regulator [Acetobacteraceae bacterium]